MARLGSTSSARARQMRRVLARWERSGLALSEFARRQGIAPSTLGWWRYVFRHAGRRGTPSPPRARARFVEVKRDEAPSASPAVLEVVLRTGQVLRVPADFDVARLRAVVTALEGAC
jgi:transposase-like protein